MPERNESKNGLTRTLGPLMLWGLGTGYVISGMYFGWNLGLEKGGTAGMAIATLIVTLMYVTFTFGYTELACAIPKAGGAFDYASRALGKNWGFVAGIAQIIEFVFAPPAIAFAIGDYMSGFLGESSKLPVAIVSYLLFTAVNIRGVKLAASFELIVTLIAITGLLAFFFLAFPAFESGNLVKDNPSGTFAGVFAAIPFAIWFYLGIEGVANAAEETIHPKRNVVIGFGSAMATLVILCLLTFISSVGINGWKSVVFPTGSSETSDSPLLLALNHVPGISDITITIFTLLGLAGLIASFHGIIFAAGRATFEFGRLGFAPKAIGRIHPKFHTPVSALLLNMFIGILALLTGKTAEIIILSVFGALTLYLISTVSLIVLRKKEPGMERPFQVPWYPVFPMVAMAIAAISLVSMLIFHPLTGIAYCGVIFLSFVLSKFYYGKAR